MGDDSYPYDYEDLAGITSSLYKLLREVAGLRAQDASRRRFVVRVQREMESMAHGWVELVKDMDDPKLAKRAAWTRSRLKHLKVPFGS